MRGRIHVLAALLAASPAAQAGLTLIVDTDAQTLRFQGSLEAEPQIQVFTHRLVWSVIPDFTAGATGTGQPTGAIPGLLSVTQTDAGATLDDTRFRFFPNGSSIDSFRLELFWMGDPGLTTVSGTGLEADYSVFGTDAISMIERSIGLTMTAFSPSIDAPPIAIVPTPGVLALMGVAGFAGVRRRR
ncbi:MAG: hypothetical protein Tsb0013_16650 [Phycisphaerales bacterium]